MEEEDSYENYKKHLEESNAMMEPEVRMPKHPMNGYMRFHLERTCEERSKDPTVNFKDLSHRIAEEWKVLDAKRKQIFNAQAELRVKERERLIQEFNRISKNDKVLSAYSRYFTKMFPIYQKECSDKKASEISKVIGQEWKKLDPGRKQAYFEEAQRQRIVVSRAEVLPEHVEAYKDSLKAFEEELKQDKDKILKKYKIKKINKKQERRKRREQARARRQEERNEERRRKIDQRSRRKREESEAKIRRKEERRQARIEERQRRKEQKKAELEEAKRRKREEIEKQREQGKRMRSLSRAKAKAAEKAEEGKKQSEQKKSVPKNAPSKSKSQPKKAPQAVAAKPAPAKAVRAPAAESKTRAASRGRPIEVSQSSDEEVIPKKRKAGRSKTPGKTEKTEQDKPVISIGMARKTIIRVEVRSSKSEEISEDKPIKRTKQIKKVKREKVTTPKKSKIQTRKRAPAAVEPKVEKATPSKKANKKVGRPKKKLA